MAVQSNYRYSLSVSGDTVFEVVSFRLMEHLSELFRLEIDAASFEDSPVFSAILDQSATLTFWQDDVPVRYVNGIVSELIQGETGMHRTRYKILIEPSFSRTNLQSDCRIFQHKDSEEIIRTVLGKSGVSRVNFHIVKPYWQREYCVQYRETDLGFIHRLAAEEGSYYYFEHTADTHTLNFTNNTATAETIGELLYEANPAGDRPEPALWRWDYREQLRTVTQTLRDYTFTNPRYNQEHNTALTQPNVDGANPTRNYEKYDYPGRYKRDEQGSPFTQYRQEYERRESEVVHAIGDDQRVIPGYRFTLKGHRRADFNQGWFVVGVVHTGRQTGVLEEESGDEGNFYQNEIKLIPQKSQWRPTPQHRPVVDGPQIAHVVGPANEEIYCDEWGRVKVQFPWDRVGEENEHSSCWVRVSQAWAGAQYGNIAIPRIGHEVIVDFLEGDPDQPIITGRTYHSTTEPPYALPENKTRMTIKSKTHKGDGFNELRFEDEKGVEEVFIHAEKDQNNVVKHDETTKVGNDRTENIGHDEEIHIGNDRTETVGRDEDIDITRNRKEHVGKNETIAVDNDRKETVGRNETIAIGKNRKKTVGGNDKLVVSKNQSVRVNMMQMETVGLAKMLSVGLGYQETVGGAKNTSVGLSHTEQTGDTRIISAGDKLKLNCGKSELTLHKDGTVEIWGDETLFAGSKLVKINGKLVDINGGKEKNSDVCIPCKLAALKANPVNAIQGIKVLGNEVDFAFGGLIPLVWSRSYYSDGVDVGWLGQGWRVQGCQYIVKEDDINVIYVDEQERRFSLPPLDKGDKVFFRSELIWVEHTIDGTYIIRPLDGSMAMEFIPLTDTHYALSTISDNNGNQQTFVYNPDTHLPQYIIDGNGRAFGFVFNNLSRDTATSDDDNPILRLTQIVLLSQRPVDSNQAMQGRTLVQYNYDANGDLVQVINHAGDIVREFAYTNHILVMHKNASGFESYYEYDKYEPSGKVLRNYTNTDEQWIFNYQPSYTEVTDTLGRTEVYHYDDNSEIVEYVGFDGKSEYSERDRFGRVTKHTDSNGRETSYEYNDRGQLTKVTRPDKLSQSYQYNDKHYLVEQTDITGNKTTYDYDERGNLISSTNAVGDTTSIAYANNGLPVVITDPLGNEHTNFYNSNNLLEKSVDCFGAEVHYSYTDWGLLASVINSCNETHYRYNDKQQLVEVRYENGGREYFEYDNAGRMVLHTDPKGNTTRYEYRVDDLLRKRINALGGQFSYEYDKAQRLTKLINENKQEYRFAYDVMDRIKAERAFDDKTTTYGFNDKGQLFAVLELATLQSQEPIRTTELQYDELGRLVAQKTYDKERSQSTQYHYDKFSRIKQVNDEQSSLAFTYDKLGRLQQQTSKHEDITQALIYAYDANHNRLQTQLPDGNVIKYAYKGTGSLHTIDFNDTRITEFTRNIMQREIGRTQGKLTTTFNRDPLIRMATQVVQADGASPVIKRDYIYDATGNLIRCHDIRSGITNYQYDSLGQISQVTTPIGEEIFAFDPAHNIVEHYTHKVENNRLEQYHGVQYVYDEFGNVIQKTTQTGEQQHYTYNLKDQLITATMSKPNQETEVWHYKYDVLGRRIAKYRENATDKNNTDKNNTDKNNTDKNNGQNSERTEFIWDGSHLVQEINPQGTYTYIYSHPASYEPLAQIYENKENKQSIAYFHTDQIGIPREMTDDNGQLLWNGTYTAWGQLKEENNPHNTHQPLRLQNQYYDRETGLHYNFFRYYDTHCGRFITQDPIKLQGGNNFYRFAPNAQGWSDPLGLAPWLIPLLAGTGRFAFTTSTRTIVTRELATKATQIGTTASVAAIAANEAVKDRADEDTNTKCKKATLNNIRKVTENTPYFTQQKKVSIPRVAAHTVLIESGSIAPPIKMDGLIIVDGNHRMVAGLLCNKIPASVPWTAAPSMPKIPLSEIIPVPNVWGN